MCWSPSTDGQDRGDIENLINDIILGYNSANAVTNKYNLKLLFNNYAKLVGTKNIFFKRRNVLVENYSHNSFL